MKKKQFESLCKSLLPNLPGFACKDWLLYAQPIGHVLRGFCCDDSSFDSQQFTVWAFLLPLYVPTPHVHFNMGHRLKDVHGCEIWWNMGDPHLRENLLAAIQRDALPFLEGVTRPDDLVMAIDRLGTNYDPYCREAVAYSLAMTDNKVAAQQALQCFIKSLDLKIAWQVEMSERATLLAEKLEADPEEARHQLAEWEQVTLKNIGLG